MIILEGLTRITGIDSQSCLSLLYRSSFWLLGEYSSHEDDHLYDNQHLMSCISCQQRSFDTRHPHLLRWRLLHLIWELRWAVPKTSLSEKRHLQIVLQALLLFPFSGLCVEIWALKQKKMDVCPQSQVPIKHGWYFEKIIKRIGFASGENDL